MKSKAKCTHIAAGLAVGCLAIAALAQPPRSARPGQPPDVRQLGGSAAPASALPRVVLEIAQGDQEWGRIVIELESEKTPRTVESFLRLVNAGFYNSTIFHRVIPGFLVQGGAYESPGALKRGTAQRPIRNEAREGLKNERGTVALARNRNPHSGTTQFFINLANNAKLDHPGHDGWGYCAFGHVVEGMDVIERIARVERRVNPDSKADQTPSLPVEPPQIRRAYRLDSAATPARPSTPPRGRPAGPERPRPDMQPTRVPPMPPQESEPPVDPEYQPYEEPAPEPAQPPDYPEQQPDDPDQPPPTDGEPYESPPDDAPPPPPDDTQPPAEDTPGQPED